MPRNSVFGACGTNAVMRLFPGAYPPGVAYSEFAMIAVFPLAASALFLFGALALYHRHPAGDGSAWLLFTWCLVSAVTPFVYAVLGDAGTHYVGGMLTAPLPAACGLAGVRRLAAAPAPALHAWRPAPMREDAGGLGVVFNRRREPSLSDQNT